MTSKREKSENVRKLERQKSIQKAIDEKEQSSGQSRQKDFGRRSCEEIRQRGLT